MTAAEFAFLAMGLVLGMAAGAALIEILRARPPVPREVRVTVAQDAIPRRASTLADPAFAAVAAEPARGGPADRREGPADAPAGIEDRRTSVRPMGAMTLALAASGSSGPAGGPDVVRVPIGRGEDPVYAAFRASTPAGPAGASARALAAGGALSSSTTAVLDRSADPVTAASSGGPGDADAGGGASAPGIGGAWAPGIDATPAAAGPCAEERRLSDERCEIAIRARAGATTADETHRAAQRSYDDHDARADQAAAAADPRAIRRAKDEAQARFRAARSIAATTDEVEGAARTWLLEINQINTDARDATAAVAREREAVRILTLDLERIAMEAEAARIAAETAEAACLAAREALAACEEALAGPVGHMPLVPSTPPDDGGGEDDEPLAAALGSGGTPRIFRLVRGDRSAMTELVDAMAGDDPEGRRHWQLALSDLVDAILADSIAAASLDFPTDHPFWGPFTIGQNRDISSALSSLGYRFDGLGGWVDGRVPSQRDLSLALGYAGLDPMRIRHWPTEAEMAELNRDVTVAADERLAGAAGDLTLGELVSMLGRRADGLADVWNHWGRLRPLLLEG